MSQQVIDAFNWNFTQYKSGTYKAFISIGASQELLEDEYIYFVTVLDDEENEIFQKEFSDIAEACDYINQRYAQDWDYIDMSVSEKSGSGCDSCVAH